MKAHDGQGRTRQGQAKRPGRGQVIAKKQGRKLFRKRHEWLPDRADSDSVTRAALWLPLLDTELLSIEIHCSWRYLSEDADER